LLYSKPTRVCTVSQASKTGHSDSSITTSTISGNTGRGIGGIYGDLEVTYSTISNNNGDGVAYFGGNVC
jgi:hypothetical protein